MRHPRAIMPSLVAASLAGALLAGPALAAPVGSKANPVKAKAAKVLGFNPAKVIVKPGALVWFKSADKQFHNAQSNKTVGGKPVFSSKVSQGTFSIRAPKKPGVYPYYCVVHKGIGQKGTLIVRK
ncbi:MAG: Copper binding protein plastocyanin/azurin family [Miltoncostaeaceae bacterium]|nr:Copper binding protein plastocyanin/azurin family [Miltoncostaeaceae bacterium]